MTDSLKDNSLQAAGYAYLVGDAALFASGMMAGRSKEAGAGLLWAAGGLACARYGNAGSDVQLKLLSRKLGHYLRGQGVVIPSMPDTQWLARDAGAIEKAEAFLYEHPSQTLNAVYALGGAMLTHSGMQHKKSWDTASGALIAAGGLAGLLISEQKPDPAHPPQGTLEKGVAWVREKPLRASGVLYTLNNATLAMSAIREAQANPGQKSYLFKFATAASYIFANTMLAISSKHNASGDNSAMEKLAQASAQVIAAQPPPLQEALLQNISGFLAGQPGAVMKADEIAKLLHGKLPAAQGRGRS